jgi:phosphoserine phosphatase RsbU/P
MQAAEHAAMQRELAAARRIQHTLVPRDPKVPGLDVAVGFVPCLAVGGDYVDTVQLPDGRTLLALADVCGKGMAAALVASGVYTLIHSGVRAGMTFRPLMEHINGYLCQTLQIGSYVTMVAGALDCRTGELEYLNAGHPPALVIRSGQPARQLAYGENLPLGCEPVPLVFQKTQIEPGELLALYSDGLTELGDESGELLGIEGLAGALWALHATPHTPAAQVATYLTAQLDAIQGTRQPLDDRTFLLVRRDAPVAADIELAADEPLYVDQSDTNMDGLVLA